MNFIETFFANLANHPHDEIVIEMHGDRPVPTTCASLARLTACARGRLREQGVSAGDRVVLVGPNRTKWVAADLAILAEGAISVPLYARQDPGELVWMIRDAEAKVVLVDNGELKATLEEAAGEEGPALPLMTYEELFAGKPVEEPPKARDADDVVTIIYTSGTSAEPKGVMLTVANVDFMLPVTRAALGRLMGKREGHDRVFHYLPLCFAGSRIVLFTCLLRANPIHLSTDLTNLKTEFLSAEPHYFLNVPTLLERIKNGVEEKVRGQGKLVHSLYEAGQKAWLRQIGGRARPGDALVSGLARRVIFQKVKAGIGPHLECLISGSAPLGADTQRWFEMLGIPVYQVYGLTETTAIVTMDEPRRAVPGHVGRVIEGCEVELSDEGELLVRGPHVFKGYWKRPEATRAAFTEDGWFRTGDQAEVGDGGNWRIVGRVKSVLVPSSGHNVTPEPIEQRIVERTPGVDHAVLMGHGRPFLTAVVSGAASRKEVQTSIDAINEELPHYRRVRAFHLTTEPFTPESGLVTANMKLKRKALEAHFAPELDRLYRDAAATRAEARR